MIAEAVSEKEAIEMKEMKPTEANPNDTALPHQDSIIPPAVNSPEVEKAAEKPGEVASPEEKVEIPSPEMATEVVSPEGVSVSVESEANK